MGAQLQCLLSHLSDRQRTQSTNRLVPTGQDPAPTPRQVQSSLVTPEKSKMGIKETGDYITARAANPRTGLISPSVVAAHTPRTPMSPGEALRLRSHDQRPRRPKIGQIKPFVQHSHQQMPKRPTSLWKQHKDGWFVETINDVILPKPLKPQANSSVVQVRKCSGDRFIIPMPSARNPRPYLSPARTAAQLALREHSTHESNEYLRTTSLSGLNNRMPSIGAGPRRFAEATKKLQLLAMNGECALSNQNNDMETVLPTTALEDHSTPNIAAKTVNPSPQVRSPSAGSPDSVMIPMISMPGSYETSSPHTNAIARKAVGSPPRTRECKGSEALIYLADVHASHRHHPTLGKRLGEQPMSESNSCRFGDLRRLPRVRTVHIDQRTPSEQSTPPTGPRAQDVFSIGERSAILINSANLLGSIKTSSPGVASKSPWDLEPDIPFLASVTSLPFHWIKDLWESTSASSSGILHLVNVLTDEGGDPFERLEAGRSLLVTGGRWVVLLAISILVLKIGIMLGQIIRVLCWPMRILIGVLR